MLTQNLKVQIGVRGRQPERGTDRNETKPENELGLVEGTGAENRTACPRTGRK